MNTEKISQSGYTATLCVLYFNIWRTDCRGL